MLLQVRDARVYYKHLVDSGIPHSAHISNTTVL